MNYRITILQFQTKYERQQTQLTTKCLPSAVMIPTVPDMKLRTVIKITIRYFILVKYITEL